jgi:hypothetical protein
MRQWIFVTATALALTVMARRACAPRSCSMQAAAAPSAPPRRFSTPLSPIALYPDALLAQMLVCAGNPEGGRAERVAQTIPR